MTGRSELQARLPVHSSHLALRFYKSDGWTKELLTSYLLRGEVLDIWPGQDVRDYWFLNHEKNSRLDMDRLYAEMVKKVFRYSETAEAHLSDLEYLKGMNW